MCGRFTLKTPAKDLARIFSMPLLDAIEPRYNIAPTQPVLTIRQSAAEPPAWAVVRWGLIPSWTHEAPASSPPLINARCESVAKKPSFRGAFKRSRCLMIADGYYEWKQDGKKKQPFYFFRRDRQPFAFAGLFETWQDPTGEPLESCALITTTPNEHIALIHDRMPVVLDPRDYAEWIDPANESVKSLERLLVATPEDAIDYHTVSPVVNNARNETPECIEPAPPEERQAVFRFDSEGN